MVKNGITLFVILLLICVSVIPSTGRDVEQSSILPLYDGKTFYVGGSGPNNYSTIQGAINDANNGDTVYVYNGSYYENIVINKSINLIGEDRDTTHIRNWEGGYVIDICDDLVNISGFRIHSSGLDDYDWGGITIGSCNNNISDNTIKGFMDEGEIGIEFSDFSNNNTITGNFILNHEIGIYLSDSNNNTIKNNNFSGNWVSIKAYDSNNNTIKDNNFPYNVHGIILQENCMNNIITRNNLSYISCCQSIGVDFSSNNNTVSNNTINSFGWTGILIQFSRDNIVSGNMIMNGINGIYLWDSSDNMILCNTVISCKEHGIYTSTSLLNEYDTHRNLTIHEDTCCNCRLHNYHVKRHFYPSNNTIFHNNFINNSQNAEDAGNNVWDDGKYGNFWSDYKERYPDAKKKQWKGIWNTPYEIQGGDNKDNYPLINQYPKSVIKTNSIDNSFNYNFLLLNWLFDNFLILQRLLDWLLQ